SSRSWQRSEHSLESKKRWPQLAKDCIPPTAERYSSHRRSVFTRPRPNLVLSRSEIPHCSEPDLILTNAVCCLGVPGWGGRCNPVNSNGAISSLCSAARRPHGRSLCRHSRRRKSQESVLSIRG